MAPTLGEEKKLWKRGFKRVAGLDEVGRGPLAGPVVAAAVVIENSKFLNTKDYKKQSDSSQIENFDELRDSKKLSPKKRERFYKIFRKTKDVKWGIGKVSEKVIDKINILEATKLAMKKAVKNLNSQTDYLIVDGRMKLDLKIPQKAIIKADEKVFSCAASSIIAKVTRDRLMEKYHKKYPKYGFNKHKGYPTELHRQMLKKYKPCKIHRHSFILVKNLLK